MALEQMFQFDNLRPLIPVILTSLLLALVVPWLVNILKVYRIFRGFPSHEFSYRSGNLHKMPATPEARIEWGRIIMDEMNPKFGVLWAGPFKPVLNLYHPEVIKKVIKSSAPKSRGFGAVYELVVPWIGNGLISSNGHTWARSRRLLTPAFHFDILRPYMEIYNTAADTMFEKLDVAADSKVKVDVCPVLTLCTLEIILKCAMSYDIDIQRQGHHPYAEACKELTYTWSERARSPLTWSPFIFKLTSAGQKFYANCRLVHQLAEEVICSRRKAIEIEGPSKNRHIDFLDILLKARDEDGKGLTTEEIRNEVDTFLFAGHDTTATSAPWILYLLASHPEYLRKVQEEVDEVLEGRDSDHIQWSDLQQGFHNLNLCIKESMRLYPPVPFIQRTLSEPIDLDGKVVPAGHDVTIAIVHMHRNPLVWEKPDEFQPERFLPENSKDRDSFAFMPFSAGARNCIGQQFAINEEKVLIARIIHRYNISVAPDSPPPDRRVSAVLKADNGIWLNLTRRNV